jgi:hypothetical protein
MKTQRIISDAPTLVAENSTFSVASTCPRVPFDIRKEFRNRISQENLVIFLYRLDKLKYVFISNIEESSFKRINIV